MRQHKTAAAIGGLFIALLWAVPSLLAATSGSRNASQASLIQTRGEESANRPPISSLTDIDGNLVGPPSSVDRRLYDKTGATVEPGHLGGPEKALRNIQGDIVGRIRESGQVEIAEPSNAITELPFSFFDPPITIMEADFSRPYIYAIQSDQFSATLLFINTGTEEIEKALPVGSNATDMSINYGEGRLYISNWLEGFTQVVNLQTQELLPPLSLGVGVYKINAGRPGRVYIEEEDQWIWIEAVDTTTGAVVGQSGEREGDGEIDPTGTYYYHCDNNISNAHIHKLDISTDTFTEIAVSLQHPYGSRNLVLSGDGSRLFWRGYVYDADLIELGSLGSEIYATTYYGDIAVGEHAVFDATTGAALSSLPVSSTVMSVSGDQEKLFLFDQASANLVVVPISGLSTIVFRDGFETGDTARWSTVVP